MTAAIELRGVEKQYRHRTVLDGIDLRIEPGTTLGLVGPNGAGKTTTLRILVGLAFRDGGDARVLGLDPSRDALGIRRRCTYLPGESGVYGHLTGRQLLDFAASFYPRRHAAVERQLSDGFALPLEQRVREYSAGMKQKLALTSVLAQDVELYLLDEPDRTLDPPARQALRDAVLRLQGEGKTILFSSHHLAEVDAVAQRLAFLLDGRIVPHEDVARAREALRGLVRLRMRTPLDLPAGARLLTEEPGGAVRVQVDGDPLGWLARFPAGAVEHVEVGATRLEDLYRSLSERPPTEVAPIDEANP